MSIAEAARYLEGYNCRRVEGLPPDGIYVVAHEPEVDWREYCGRYPLVYIAVETPTGFYIYGDAPPGKTPENCRVTTFLCSYYDERTALRLLVEYARKVKRLAWIHIHKEVLKAAGYCAEDPAYCDLMQLFTTEEEEEKGRGDPAPPAEEEPDAASPSDGTSPSDTVSPSGAASPSDGTSPSDAVSPSSGWAADGASPSDGASPPSGWAAGVAPRGFPPELLEAVRRYCGCALECLRRCGCYGD